MARLKAPEPPRRGTFPPELNDRDAECWHSDAAAAEWYRRYRLGAPRPVDRGPWQAMGRGAHRRHNDALQAWAESRGYVNQHSFPDWHRLHAVGYGIS